MNGQDMSWFVRRFMEPETLTSDEMERFCKLAAARAVAAEREACARVCEETTASWSQYVYNSGCTDCAAAIRARGEK